MYCLAAACKYHPPWLELSAPGLAWWVGSVHPVVRKCGGCRAGTRATVLMSLRNSQLLHFRGPRDDVATRDDTAQASCETSAPDSATIPHRSFHSEQSEIG